MVFRLARALRRWQNVGCSSRRVQWFGSRRTGSAFRTRLLLSCCTSPAGSRQEREIAVSPTDKKLQAGGDPGRVSPLAGLVDLRSDTVTGPTAAMRRAMAEAEVGDDVYGEDPTVNRLEARAAEIFGKDAALFVPTGCMGNLIAIKVWTHHGNEIVCEERAHILDWEMAMPAFFSGCLIRTLRGEDGILTWSEIKNKIPSSSYARAQT